MSGFTVHAPPRAELIQRQRREQRLYRSAAIGSVLRTRGVPESVEASLALVPRGSRLRRADIRESSCIVEAIDTPAIHQEFGIQGDTVEVEHLDLRWADGASTPVEYPRYYCRDRADRSGEPVAHVDSLAHWNSMTLPLFRPDPATVPNGNPLLKVSTSRRAESFTAAVRVRDTVLFFIPVFDWLVALHMHPFYRQAYYRRAPVDSVARMASARLENLLIRLVAELSPPSRTSGTCSPWSDGSLPAFTVRHDYDRSVEAAAVEDLLDFHDTVGVRSTWFFMSRLLPGAQMRLIRSRGHEVALHTEASSFHGFVEELNRFSDATGHPPAGYSCHGGRSGAGFLGQKQQAWAHANGLLYAEGLGLLSNLPHPCISTLGCIPDAIDLMVTPAHHSLDANVRPDGHRLSDLMRTLPPRLRAQEHVILMNHPDIHRDQLKVLLRGIDLSNAWCCTIEEAMNHFRLEHFAGDRRTGIPAGSDRAARMPRAKEDR